MKVEPDPICDRCGDPSSEHTDGPDGRGNIKRACYGFYLIPWPEKGGKS